MLVSFLQLENISLEFVTFVNTEVFMLVSPVQLANIRKASITFVNPDVSMLVSPVQFWKILISSIMLLGSLHIPERFVQPKNKHLLSAVYVAVEKSLGVKSRK